MFKQTVAGIKTIFKDKGSYKIAVGAALLLGYFYYWLLLKTTTLPMFFQMTVDGEFGKYSYAYAATYWITTLLMLPLAGISAAALVWLWKRSQLSKRASSSSFAAAFVGALGSGCPVCGAFLLSVLGFTGGVAVLPLQGLELKLASLALFAGTTAFTSRKVHQLSHNECEDCNDIPGHHKDKEKNTIQPSRPNRLLILPLDKIIIFFLSGLFIINQFLITSQAGAMGMNTGSVSQLFGIKTAAAASIIAPKLNPDGRTTSLVEQPTISELPANPNTGDALADAKVVMIAAGKPFYAPDDIAFDDPINAQKKWGAYEQSITLTGELEQRNQWLVSNMACSYCCGGPTSVTTINRCGCAHAKAARGFFEFMLQNYGDKYSNDQLLGEGHRWYAIWYPKGMLEDYLLATGKSEALPHTTHGGAGADGRHGL